ncbi:conserved hypothetical protein [Verticillium alfalfae VaMs.102]|uniref:Uncharacterized protein n=1 Tax=Verticillium alfalfae (strain VaMs.102 / ATCC MYA-4576 / FGSC 10136) TaxID=526221 RepID=C9SV51_VERA1|nr:conserved hypothetical protein [Verticillium alfalfae VaMs.102]EEY22666.1 conserved hypothetical protein [Verticillium alfalfae VaMs.102]
MAPDTDDDLFLMIDGYDVQLQLGPEVLIQRYFKVVAAEDERIIQQLGPALAEEVAGPLGRHVVFGADKGLQELGRINAQLEEDSGAKHPSHVNDALWPKFGPKSNHHIAIDYWSNLFQTWAGYTEYVDWRTFDRPGHAFTVDQNVRAEATFRPWDLHLAGDAMRAVHRIFAAAKRSTLMGKTSDELILESQFGSNIITKTTMPIYHCTGAKDALEAFWPRCGSSHTSEVL